jgi:hypothetical protein
MSFKFNQTVAGSSANTGRAVIRLGRGSPDTSLVLPMETDLATAEGLRAINERFDQIERRLRHAEEMEISLAAKFGYGELAALNPTAQPVTGAKVVLDKLGTWLILASFDFTSAVAAEAFVVIDPETTTSAKKQDAYVRAAGNLTLTAWCLFTASAIPRLAQLYAKGTSGALDAAGTSIAALWVGKWTPGDKRFGRDVPSQYTGATDMNGDPLTDHGEEARWPASDHPDVISQGVELTL